jgi:uncharacterized protein (DUF2249 family)/iron-sulfur cluster repair protein YtfE (RIC family)
MPALHASRLVDVQAIPPRDRHTTIFTAFEDLSEGNAMTLVVDHDPKPLLYELQAERSGLFDWSPLEAGPDLWRVEIVKRAQADAIGRSVYEYLQWDHGRLDTLLEETTALLKAGSPREADARFAEFATGLRRHIKMEEEVLFPAFEEFTHFGNSGPTRVMRDEHVEIKRILGDIGELLGQPSPSVGAYERLRNDLLSVLGEHNGKEEHIIYPMTDRELPPPQRDELIRIMQRV